MAAIEELAATVGYATLYLETGPKQPGARALYEHLGWETVERYPQGAHVHDTGTRFRRQLAAPDPAST
jgi:GNAT superfamily N-acetyltransferase